MTTETTQEPTTPELTLIDLQNIRAIIDVAAKRGAFAANEMASLGAVYSKLDAFLNAAAPATTETQEQSKE